MQLPSSVHWIAGHGVLQDQRAELVFRTPARRPREPSLYRPRRAFHLEKEKDNNGRKDGIDSLTVPTACHAMEHTDPMGSVA